MIASATKTNSFNGPKIIVKYIFKIVGSGHVSDLISSEIEYHTTPEKLTAAGSAVEVLMPSVL